MRCYDKECLCYTNEEDENCMAAFASGVENKICRKEKDYSKIEEVE